MFPNQNSNMANFLQGGSLRAAAAPQLQVSQPQQARLQVAPVAPQRLSMGGQAPQPAYRVQPVHNPTLLNPGNQNFAPPAPHPSLGSNWLHGLGNFAQGTIRQLNPFDGGATANHPSAHPLRQFTNNNLPQILHAGDQTHLPGGGVQTWNNFTGNNHQALYLYQSTPGGTITPTAPGRAVFPDQVHNRLAIDPRSTPLSTAVFAPTNNETQAVIDHASSTYNWSPQFKAIAQAAQPQVMHITSGERTNLAKGLVPAAYYAHGYVGNYSNDQAIAYSPGYGTSPPAVTHEALHAAYARVPGAPQQFAKAYKAGVSDDIKNYLDSRLQGYKGYKGKASLNNLNNLPRGLRTEVHSYLSEYPMTGLGKVLPPALQAYYQQFINPNQAIPTLQKRYGVRSSIQEALDGYRSRTGQPQQEQ